MEFKYRVVDAFVESIKLICILMVAIIFGIVLPLFLPFATKYLLLSLGVSIAAAEFIALMSMMIYFIFGTSFIMFL